MEVVDSIFCRYWKLLIYLSRYFCINHEFVESEPLTSVIEEVEKIGNIVMGNRHLIVRGYWRWHSSRFWTWNIYQQSQWSACKNNIVLMLLERVNNDSKSSIITDDETDQRNKNSSHSIKNLDGLSKCSASRISSRK